MNQSLEISVWELINDAHLDFSHGRENGLEKKLPFPRYDKTIRGTETYVMASSYNFLYYEIVEIHQANAIKVQQI